MEFDSIPDSVNLAVDVQRAMAEGAAGTPLDTRITYRIGIDIGDIIVAGGVVYSDEVNIAGTANNRTGTWA